jgi:hypothetical protein
VGERKRRGRPSSLAADRRRRRRRRRSHRGRLIVVVAPGWRRKSRERSRSRFIQRPTAPYFPTGEEETSEETSRGYHLEGSGRGLERHPPTRGTYECKKERKEFFLTRPRTHTRAPSVGYW